MLPMTDDERRMLQEIWRAVIGERVNGQEVNPGLVRRVARLERWRYAAITALFAGAFGGTLTGTLL